MKFKTLILLIVFSCSAKFIRSQSIGMLFPESFSLYNNSKSIPVIPYIDSLIQIYGNLNIKYLKTDSSEFVFEGINKIKSVAFRYAVKLESMGDSRFREININYKNSKIDSLSIYQWISRKSIKKRLAEKKTYLYTGDQLKQTNYLNYDTLGKIAQSSHTIYVKETDSTYTSEQTTQIPVLLQTIKTTSRWKYFPAIKSLKITNLQTQTIKENIAQEPKTYNWNYNQKGNVMTYSEFDDNHTQIPLCHIEFTNTGKIKLLKISTKKNNYNFFSNEYQYTDFDSLSQIVCRSFSDSITSFKRQYSYNEHKELVSILDFYNFNIANANTLTILKPDFFNDNPKDINRRMAPSSDGNQYVYLHNTLLLVKDYKNCYSEKLQSLFLDQVDTSWMSENRSQDLLTEKMFLFFKNIRALKTNIDSVKIAIREVDTLYFNRKLYENTIDLTYRKTLTNDDIKLGYSLIRSESFSEENIDSYVFYPPTVKSDYFFGVQLPVVNFNDKDYEYVVKQMDKNQIVAAAFAHQNIPTVRLKQKRQIKNDQVYSEYSNDTLGKYLRWIFFKPDQHKLTGLLSNSNYLENIRMTVDDNGFIKSILNNQYANRKNDKNLNQKVKISGTLTSYLPFSVDQDFTKVNIANEMLKSTFNNVGSIKNIITDQIAFDLKGQRYDTTIMNKVISFDANVLETEEGGLYSTGKIKANVYKFLNDKVVFHKTVTYSKKDSSVSSYISRTRLFINDTSQIIDTIIYLVNSKNTKLETIMKFSVQNSKIKFSIFKRESFTIKDLSKYPHIYPIQVVQNLTTRETQFDSLVYYPNTSIITYSKKNWIKMNSKDMSLTKQTLVEKFIYDKNYFLISKKLFENGKEMMNKELKGKTIYFN